MQHTYLRTIGYSIAAVSTVLLVTSCKHKENPKPVSVTAPLDFTYTGGMRIYDTVVFHSTAPGTSTFLWIFGDGTTAADSMPSHVYTSVKYRSLTVMVPDTVTMIINNDTAHAVVKTLKISPGAGRLTGAWHWTAGRYVPYGSHAASDTARSINDTTFMITAIDDSTIMAWGQTLPFCAVLNSYCVLNMYTSHLGASIKYTPDSIFFANSCCGGIGYWN